MKRWIISILVLAIVGAGFYYGYQKGHSTKPSLNTPQTRTANLPMSSQETAAAKEVAVNFFQACTTGDWDKAFAYYPMRDDKEKVLLKDYLGGMEIISIGEPYKKRAEYPGLFVPYEIKLKSGEIKKYDLAIRNDNPTKTWTVDGGL